MKKIREYIIPFLFPINLLVNSISNYFNYSLYLKLILLLVTIAVIQIFYKGSTKELFDKLKENQKFILILLSFLFYITLSLLWTTNFAFSLLKLSHIIIGNLSLMILFFFLCQNKNRLTITFKFIILFVIITGTIALFIQPFNFTSTYSFELTRWSHVVYGRFSGLSVVLVFIFLTNADDKFNKITFYLILFYLFLILSYTGLRAGTISVFVTLIMYFSYKIIIAENKRKIFTDFLIILLILSTAYLISINFFNSSLSERFNSIKEMVSFGKTDDGTINSRLEAYKIGFKLFEENFIFGAGLGSFNSNLFGSDIGIILKYPHNIIIEFLCELGIIGFLFFSLFIYSVFRNLIKQKSELLLILIYGLTLGMFSKDLSSNGLIWMFLSILILKKII